jgi:hypothetical protein
MNVLTSVATEGDPMGLLAGIQGLYRDGDLNEFEQTLGAMAKRYLAGD